MPLQKARSAADTAIKSAIALAPNSSSVHLQLAQIHLILDLDYARAEAELFQLQSQIPTYTGIRYLLANIDLREGRASEALQRLANVSALTAVSEDAIFMAGTALIRNVVGDYEGALQATSRGLELALAGPPASMALWPRCGEPL